MKKRFWSKKFIFCEVMILLLWLSTDVLPQSVKRQCIPVYGTSSFSADVGLLQTAGQSYITGDAGTVLQGFQQPVVFEIQNARSSKWSPEITVFPNPAAYSVTVSTNSVFEESILTVTDLSGKMVFSENLAHLSAFTFHCENWKSGVYLITVSGDQDQTVKLIISK